MGWNKGICTPLLLLGAVVGLAWLASYGRGLELRLPAGVGGTAASMCVYRGLAVVTLIENAPAERSSHAGLSPGNDAIGAACWDAQHWANTWAGISACEGVVWLADAEGEGCSRTYRGFTLPLWLMVVTCAIPIAMRFCAVRRMHRRAALGLCRDCGYDLRGLNIECPACAARRFVVGGGTRLQAITN